MDSSSGQINADITAVVEIVRELTGLPSQWTGRLELVPNAHFRGRKPFACEIQLDAGLAQQPQRWSTLIHEALHSVSVGYIAIDFWQYPGWEEGVVENLQRLLRPTVLTRLQVGVDETLYVTIDAGHQYNGYIRALERLRLFIEEPATEFYLALLKTPIKERPGFLFGKGNGLPSQERVRFIAAYSAANAILKTGL